MTTLLVIGGIVVGVAVGGTAAVYWIGYQMFKNF